MKCRSALSSVVVLQGHVLSSENVTCFGRFLHSIVGVSCPCSLASCLLCSVVNCTELSIVHSDMTGKDDDLYT